jgi:hypothetical protein
MKEDTQEEP